MVAAKIILDRIAPPPKHTKIVQFDAADFLYRRYLRRPVLALGCLFERSDIRR
jgi:hypothetical protein